MHLWLGCLIRWSHPSSVALELTIKKKKVEMWFLYITKQYNYMKPEVQFLCQAYSLWFFLNKEGRCLLNPLGTDYIFKGTDLFSLAKEKRNFSLYWNTASVNPVYCLWIIFAHVVNETTHCMRPAYWTKKSRSRDHTQLSSMYQQLLL